MRGVRRRLAAGGLVLAAFGMVAGPAAAATDAPDLDAFSGCVSAHSALARMRTGAPLNATQRSLVVATIAASQTRGARKVAKRLRRAKSAAAVEAAMVALTTWCTAHGVPPITVPPTAAPGQD